MQGIRRQIAAREELNQAAADRPAVQKVTENKPFTPEQFFALIKEYAAAYRDSEPMKFLAMTEGNWEMADEFTARITLSNPLLEAYLVKAKQEILPEIRQKLQNNRADLICKLGREAIDKPAEPTKREELQKLAEQFPLLEDLKKLLGLELD